LYPNVHAIHRYRMQSDQKGNRLPFATALKVLWALLANCKRAMEDSMQKLRKLWMICIKYLIYLRHVERAQIFLELLQKVMMMSYLLEWVKKSKQTLLIKSYFREVHQGLYNLITAQYYVLRRYLKILHLKRKQLITRLMMWRVRAGVCNRVQRLWCFLRKL
jgi:hypothetical protein